MKTLILSAALPIVFLAGCATTREATSAELSSCEKMEQTMGTNAAHDHNSLKGMGMNSMNISHERCQQMLGTRQ